MNLYEAFMKAATPLKASTGGPQHLTVSKQIRFTVALATAL